MNLTNACSTLPKVISVANTFPINALQDWTVELKDARRSATWTLQLCLKAKPSWLQIMLYPQRPGKCKKQTSSINGGKVRLSFEALHFIIGSIIYSVTLLYINRRAAFLFTPIKRIKFRQRTFGCRLFAKVW